MELYTIVADKFRNEEKPKLHGNVLWDILHLLVLSKMLRSKSCTPRYRIRHSKYICNIHQFGFDTLKDSKVVQCRTTSCCKRKTWKSL